MLIHNPLPVGSIDTISMKYYLYLLSLSLFVFSCREENKIPDVSHIQAPTQIYHFSQDLFATDTTDMLSQLKGLQKAYPAFFPLYFNAAVAILNDTILDEVAAVEIKEFLKYDSIVALQNNVQAKFGEFSRWERELQDLNKRIKYYFPEEKVPSYYTFISEYSYGSFIFNDTMGRDGIGIGLDLYLGPDYDYRARNPYDNSFSAYLTKNYTPDFITKLAAESWVVDKMPPPRDNRLVDGLIYEGKRLFLIKKLVPTIPDTVLFGHTPEQMDWLKENERNIWAHLLDEDLIYTRDNGKIIRLINPSPSSAGMPPESPGQAALYSAYKIVDFFAKRNPDMNLKELMELNDAQKILSGSRYKP